MFISLEIVGNFFNHQIVFGDNVPQIQSNYHGATGPNPHITKGIFHRQLPGFLIIQLQQGIGFGDGSGGSLKFFLILQNTPLVHLLPVLRNIQFPLAGLLIVIGKFDFIVGLFINAG